MKLRMTDRQLRFTASYLKTVPLAALALLILRWDTVAGFWGVMRLIGDSVWQGSVWPLYLIVLVFGRG